MTGLRLQVDLPHPRGHVWRALTEARLLSQWFQPVAGWRVLPTDELPSFAPFDLETVTADPPRKLVQRWRGDDFLSEVTWDLIATQTGCRLHLTQTGLLGSQQAGRRLELLDGYRIMLDHRLPDTLARLARGESPRPLRPRREPTPRNTTRMAMLSLVGAMVLVMLTVTASAVWLHSGHPVAADVRPSHGLGTGTQPGESPPATPGTRTTPAPPRTRPTPAPTHQPPPTLIPTLPALPVTATFRTATLLGLGGFDVEVTVTNPSVETHKTWSVVLVMPDATLVQNRTPDLVTLQQAGNQVTVTPVDPAEQVTFVIRFPALLAIGKNVQTCVIDGQPCTRRAG